MSAMQTSGPKLSNSREIRSLVGSVTRGSMLIDFILDHRNLCRTPARPGDEPAVAAESATTLKYMVVTSLQKTPFHAFRREYKRRQKSLRLGRQP
jgi:hypothetical protein